MRKQLKTRTIGNLLGRFVLTAAIAGGALNPTLAFAVESIVKCNVSQASDDRLGTAGDDLYYKFEHTKPAGQEFLVSFQSWDSGQGQWAPNGCGVCEAHPNYYRIATINNLPDSNTEQGQSWTVEWKFDRQTGALKIAGTYAHWHVDASAAGGRTYISEPMSLEASCQPSSDPAASVQKGAF